jgi:hypothetical protein
VRHLVLPGDLANTDTVLAFVAREISPDTYVNIMRQYFPCYRAWDYPPLDRPITPDEDEQARAALAALLLISATDVLAQGMKWRRQRGLGTRRGLWPDGSGARGSPCRANPP